MDSKNDRLCFTFKPVDAASRNLIHGWMTQGYVNEWINGECLKRTLADLDAFFLGASSFQHWLSYDVDIPFGYLLTSEVKKDGEDEYACFCKKSGRAITLDIMIGDPKYLGRGLAHQVIQEFLLSQFSSVHEVLIDPEVMNRRAIHVYEKAGFSIVKEFIPSHSTRPHYMMRLDMEKLKRTVTKPTAQYVQHKGLNLWCEIIGDPEKPAVLLICGAGAHAHFWTDAFCDTLVNGGYYVIRFDHRDSGLSSAVDFEKEPYSVVDLSEDAVAILNAFHIKKAHVVGHSMGGTIAQLLAVSHSDRLMSFTSVSVSALGVPVTPSKEVMAVLLENKPTQNFGESLDGFMRSWDILNGKLPLDVEMAKEYTEELYTRSLHPVGVAWNHIRCQEKLPNLSTQLNKAVVPALFLHGEKDVLIPIEMALNAARAIPNASLEILPQMGHMMFHKGLQQQIAALVLQHLKRAEKGGSPS